MTHEQPDFIEAYNAVRVPDVLHSMDAIDEAVKEASDTFFGDIRDSFDLTDHAAFHLFEIQHKMLVPAYPDGTPASERVLASDDYIRTFRRQGGQAIAAVLYTRTDTNYQDAHFSKYPLLPETEAEIRTFHRLDRIVLGLE